MIIAILFSVLFITMSVGSWFAGMESVFAKILLSVMGVVMSLHLIVRSLLGRKIGYEVSVVQ